MSSHSGSRDLIRFHGQLHLILWTHSTLNIGVLPHQYIHQTVRLGKKAVRCFRPCQPPAFDLREAWYYRLFRNRRIIALVSCKLKGPVEHELDRAHAASNDPIIAESVALLCLGGLASEPLLSVQISAMASTGARNTVASVRRREVPDSLKAHLDQD